jgi:hypothetical protein
MDHYVAIFATSLTMEATIATEGTQPARKTIDAHIQRAKDPSTPFSLHGSTFDGRFRLDTDRSTETKECTKGMHENVLNRKTTTYSFDPRTDGSFDTKNSKIQISM